MSSPVVRNARGVADRSGSEASKSTSSGATKYTFPYFVRKAQTEGNWTIQVQAGSERLPANVTVAVGTRDECEAAAQAWNLLARGKRVRILEE